MNLKSLRKNYSKLLATFKNAGIQLTESQKEDLDTFMLALESTIAKTKEATVKATKKVVEARLSKEYKKVFESILKHQAENAELAGKIQNKVKTIKESKKIARAVNNYLDMYVEETLPKKALVDYSKMEKYEKVMESLRDTLLVNEDAVEKKVAELRGQYISENQRLAAEKAKLEKQLNESISKGLKLNKKLSAEKAKTLLESKLKDLPTFEAKRVRARLANASVEEIEKKFKTVLESVKDDLKEEADAEETSLEEEINNIIEGEGDSSEKNGDEDGQSDDNVDEAEGDESDGKEDVEEAEGDGDEEYDTEKDLEEDDDVELDPSEKVDESYMNRWISRYKSITPLR